MFLPLCGQIHCDRKGVGRTSRAHDKSEYPKRLLPSPPHPVQIEGASFTDNASYRLALSPEPLSAFCASTSRKYAQRTSADFLCRAVNQSAADTQQCNAETTWCTASLARWTNTFLSSKSIDTSFKYNDYTVFARHCVQAIYKTSQFYA